MPGVEPTELVPWALTGTDTFRRRVNPRNEFVQTGRIQTFSDRLLLPHAGKARGQSIRFV